MEYKGNNKILRITDEGVSLTFRFGGAGVIIPFQNIASVEFKKAGGLLNGYLHFTLIGEPNSKATINRMDKYTASFSTFGRGNEKFAEAKKIIEENIVQVKKINSTLGRVTELLSTPQRLQKEQQIKIKEDRMIIKNMNKQSQSNNNKKWYKTDGGIIALLFFFLPVGVFLMLKYAHWNKTVKWIITGIFGLFILVSAISGDSSKTSTGTPQPTQEQTVQATTQVTQKPTSQPVKKMNIVVTSMIVKKVAPNTYRYFFNIANKDVTDFKGDLSIQIYNGHDDPQPLIWGGGTESFGDTPIQSGLNRVTHIDDSHAPYQVDGIDGVTSFDFDASINDDNVANGKDKISDQYENSLRL
jgi:hypothetical protein